MAIVTIKNISGDVLHIQEIYDDIEPDEVMVIERALVDWSRMNLFNAQIGAGDIEIQSVSVTPEELFWLQQGSGGVMTAENVGAGAGQVYKEISSNSLKLRTLQAGTNVTLATTGDTITINSTGGGGGAVGSIFVADVDGQGGGIVGSKVYLDPGHTILAACTTYTPNIVVTVRSSHPQVVVNGVTAFLPPGSGGYYGTVNTTIAASGLVDAHIDLAGGAVTSVDVTLDSPPQILTLIFTGGYPGSQTEYKAGDTAHLSGTTDKAATTIQVLNFGACSASSVGVSGTSFSISVTIGATGLTTTPLRARCRAGNADGAFGATFDTTNTVNCNNTYPTIAFGAITYPATQGALKNSEQAAVAFIYSNTNTILFSSPISELSITNPGTLASSKTVTRIAGSYNISTPNLQAVATRTANAAQTTTQTTVFIAHVAAVITVSTPAARLRSGGNDGTVAQDHTCNIASTQNLLAAPTMSAAPGGGVLQGSAWVGGPTTYSRALRVIDTDVKSTYSWQSLSATNLSGLVTTTISTGATYTLGGFVPRSLTFASFVQTTTLHVPVTDYNKLQAGIFSATNQPAVRTTVQGDHANHIDQFTVDSLMTNPTTLWWNDQAAASSNSSGTAQIINVEEVV